MANRFIKSTINWAELAKLVTEEEMGKFLSFKAKSDAYLQRVQANPPSPPKINWEQYQKTVPIPGLVDKLKSEYESYKVPYPDDKLSAEVDAQWATLQSKINTFCAERQLEIDEATKELDKINSLPNFEDITLEMFYDLYPDQALDPVKRPTFWPHTEDEQLNYVPPEPSSKDH